MPKKLCNIRMLTKDYERPGLNHYYWGKYSVTETKMGGEHTVSFCVYDDQKPLKMEDMVKVIGHLGMRKSVVYRSERGHLDLCTLHYFSQPDPSATAPIFNEVFSDETGKRFAKPGLLTKDERARLMEEYRRYEEQL